MRSVRVEAVFALLALGCSESTTPSPAAGSAATCAAVACDGGNGSGSGGGATAPAVGNPASSNEGPALGLPVDRDPSPDGAGSRRADGGVAGDATAGDASAPSLDRCDVGVLDPSRPPTALTLRGNLGAHDPVIIAAAGRYYYYSTGDGIAAKTSPDLLDWSQQPAVFPTTPAWFARAVPAYEPRNIWAPDVSYFGGQYHLYYSVSSFGSNRSCIGHATRAALDAGEWTDHEAVFCSNPPGQVDDYNAIDPNVVLDVDGTPWLAFGSFWSGIHLIRLDDSGARSGSELIALASRAGGAIEAPFIVRRCGYFYLFVSFDACCRGADSTYNLRVGRSEELAGPYLARDGTPMLAGGGTLVLAAGGPWVGPGHNAVLIDGSRAYNVYHAYAADDGASQLRIAELVWDAESWPLSGGP
jgi:arabinan endo-1,5-alpha-L-arabinosidase